MQIGKVMFNKRDLSEKLNVSYATICNWLKTNNIEQDEYGTYFRVMTTETENLNYREPKTNTYQLVIHFPENYNTTNYQNIIEALEINVNSHQVTS